MRKQGFLSLLYTARWGSFFRNSKNREPRGENALGQRCPGVFLSDFCTCGAVGKVCGHTRRTARPAERRTRKTHAAPAKPHIPAAYRSRGNDPFAKVRSKANGILRRMHLSAAEPICPKSESFGAPCGTEKIRRSRIIGKIFKFFEKILISVQRNRTKSRYYNYGVCIPGARDFSECVFCSSDVPNAFAVHAPRGAEGPCDRPDIFRTAERDFPHPRRGRKARRALRRRRSIRRVRNRSEMP